MKKRLVTAVAVATALTLGLTACSRSLRPPPPTPQRRRRSTRRSARCTTRPTTRAGSSRWPSRRTGTRSTPATRTTACRGTSSGSTAAPLTMFKPAPGAERQRARHRTSPRAWACPATAARPGPTSCVPGVKFEDGTPITSKDVKYAVERSIDKDVLVNGPTYFDDFLDLAGLHAARTRTRASEHRTAIDTPDDRTIVFHLKQAVRWLRLLRACCRRRFRCRQAKDTGGASTRSTSSRRARTCSTPTSRARASR